MNELALFSGAGGGILGGHLLGWRTVCAVEVAAYPRRVLLARQRDGMLPAFPVWDDVRTFDGRPWKGSVDVISGGFPCQDISVAGKGDGLDGERSGLWTEFARIIGEVEPAYCFVENSPMLTSRGLDRVLGDLASLGYDAEWGVLGADDAGAPHRRERIWIVAHTNGGNAQRGSREGSGIRGAEVGGGADDHIGGSGEEHSTDRQHPIGQLADPMLRGCVHGQTEERTAEGGIDAQREPLASGEDVPHANNDRLQGRLHQGIADELGRDRPNGPIAERGPLVGSELHGEGWWATEPRLGRVAHELADRMDGSKTTGQ